MVNAASNLNKINEAAEIRSPTRVEKLVRWIPFGRYAAKVDDHP